MSDEDIVKGCINNNPIAQRVLYEKYARKMYGVCLRYTNDRDEAEDVLQNGFIKIFENIAKFKGTGSFEGWIRRIIVNTALNNYRQNLQNKNKVDLYTVDYKIEGTENIHSTINAKELMKLIQMLPPGFKMVFNLYAIEGYTHKEIAEMLNISEGTSKSQFSRARAFLQKMLSKENKVDVDFNNEDNYTWN